MGDFNGDGKLDLAIANRGARNVSVRLGNGLGGFTIAPDVPVGTGSSPSSVAVGDFNGDGKLDFATANSGSSSVSVRRGDGSGVFAGTTTVSVGSSPSSMVMGDFNGDGKLDLATANSSQSYVSVRLGNGLGGFTSAPNVSFDLTQDAVTVGDFNGDGNLDLATVDTFTITLSVLLGDGLGGFSGTSNFTVASSPSFVTVGDFNGDGRPDLATANSGSTSSNVSVLLNNYPIRVNLSVSTSTGTEAGTTAITVTATAATPVPSDQTVNLAVTGTGITTGDYTLTDGDAAAGIQIKILSGQTTGTVTFTVVDDLENEGDETATLTISSPSTGLTLGTTLSQNITITDNDTNAPPTAVVLTPSSASLAENASTAEAIELSTISITDDGAGTNTLSLSGADAASFEIVSGKLRLKAGVVLDFETKPSYLVRVDVDDTTVGGTPDAFADFTLNLTNVAEVHLAASAATGTEAGQTVITVTATADSAVIGDQTVDLAVTGTGITTGDYTLTDGDVAAGIQIKILSGQTTGTVTFTVVDDLENEGDETATLTISSPSTGLMLGTTLSQNIAITDNDTAVDITAPTATVRSLPLTTTTSAITLAIDTNDPAGAVGNPVSGVASYDVYVAVDSGAWSLFADDVPASQSTVNFTPSSNHRYWFRAIAKDNAGNTEVESANPLPEANTFVTDVEGPNTSVTSATPDANGLFTLNLQGSDVGGSTVNRFRVFVKIDDGTAVEIPQTNVDAGTANGSGVHAATTTYQGLRDGVSHTYTFFTRGIDSKGNLEAAPTDANADIRQTHTFATPVALAATDIEVQNGQAQRSYIRNVDLLFNDTNGLQSLIDNDRIRVERFDLLNAAPTAGTGTNVSIVGAALNGNSIKLDFGAGGLGGVGRAGNGFYRILVDTDGDGSFNDSKFEFFRLYGDSNGDGKVTSVDGTVTEDLTGDGLVNATDRSIWRSERSFKLLDGLFSQLDD